MLHLFHHSQTQKNDAHYTVLLDDLERTKKELDHVYATFSNGLLYRSCIPRYAAAFWRCCIHSPVSVLP